jgi:hypothetical protein
MFLETNSHERFALMICVDVPRRRIAWTVHGGEQRRDQGFGSSMARMNTACCGIEAVDGRGTHRWDRH